MLSVERRKCILDIMKEKGFGIVAELASHFNVAEETIRRDLQKLEDSGLIVRTHGGAVLYDKDLPVLTSEVRETLNKEGKMAIAKEAAKLIENGDIIFCDASTTAYFLSREMKGMKDITVITNSLRIINELSGKEDINLVCTGGSFNPNNKSFIGKMSIEATAGAYAADKCFLSCNGVLPELGILEKNQEEAVIKKHMCDNSKDVFVLCDKTKLGRTRLNIVAPINRAKMLITDVDQDNEITKSIEEKGVQIAFVKS